MNALTRGSPMLTFLIFPLACKRFRNQGLWNLASGVALVQTESFQLRNRLPLDDLFGDLSDHGPGPLRADQLGKFAHRFAEPRRAMARVMGVGSQQVYVPFLHQLPGNPDNLASEAARQAAGGQLGQTAQVYQPPQEPASAGSGQDRVAPGRVVPPHRLCGYQLQAAGRSGDQGL